ncbi:MAG: pilus assembly protein TadG-related protein, partial [Alphaproteobacteria bacterium]
MRRKHSARSFLNRFSRNERGNFAIILAIIAIPLMGIVGLGIDLTRAYIAQTRLQNAVDNAALAAAGMSGMCTSNTDTSAQCTKMKQIATNYFYSNYKANFWAPPTTPTLNIDADGTMHVSATATSPNYFLIIFGYPQFTVASTADAVGGGTKHMEVAMVLDVTSSMCNTGVSCTPTSSNPKLKALHDASTDLVNILFGPDTTSNYLQIGIVPFSGSVRV